MTVKELRGVLFTLPDELEVYAEDGKNEFNPEDRYEVYDVSDIDIAHSPYHKERIAVIRYEAE